MNQWTRSAHRTATMISRTIRSGAQRAAIGARTFATSRIALQANEKPISSDVNMKSGNSWTPSHDEGESISSITDELVGMTKQLQENYQPPIQIDPSLTKKFDTGTTYTPFDFSVDKIIINRREAKKNSSVIQDPFEKTGIDPRDLYTMPEILSRFVTSTGQILPRDITGCNSKNQKKLGIAIKRARAAGLLSTVHKDVKYLPFRIL